jgi:hypothetical protein
MSENNARVCAKGSSSSHDSKSMSNKERENERSADDILSSSAFRFLLICE